MKKILTVVFLLICLTAYADHRYTRAELERMSRAQLIGIVLDLQRGATYFEAARDIAHRGFEASAVASSE